MLDIVEEETGFRPTLLNRWSDQCAGQFRSQNTNYNLLCTRERVCQQLLDVIWNYFESHEGKNTSDMLGGLCKQAYLAIMRRLFNLLNAVDGVGVVDPDADQLMAIAEQVKERMLAGLNIVDGRLGTFSFFKYNIPVVLCIQTEDNLCVMSQPVYFLIQLLLAHLLSLSLSLSL